jgi:FkbM family methyltransferase
MNFHTDPARANWDRRIVAEVPEHYTYADIFDWRDMHTVIDVGAHIGAFSVWLKSINPDVRIAAIEAERENYELALRNTEGLDGITLYHGAVELGNTPLMLTPYREADNPGSHTLQPLTEGGKAYDGPRFDLRTIIVSRMWDHADAIKLDCEGSEYGILAYERIDVLRKARVIVGEYHDGPDRFRRECIQRLAYWFDVVHLDTLPQGHFCMVHKDYRPCG